MSMLTRACTALSVSLALATSAAAQRQIVRPPTGPLFRYNGDTIWTERDTSAIRVVYNGDTVTRVWSINDVVKSTLVYAVNGDVAKIVDSRDGNGVQRTEELGRTSPSRILIGDREMLQSALRTTNMPLSNRNAPDPLPAQPVTSVLSYSTSIVQHLDTALYVRGCLGRAKLDTTTFVFRGDITIERLSPRRIFGAGMAFALTSAMHNANVQKSLASMGSASANVPARPHDCAAAVPAPLTGDRAMYYVGSVTRIHNDTIWRERDSTVSRDVFRKDTVQRSYSMNGRGTVATYVIDGDSARTIDFVNMDGSRRTESIGQTVPATTVLGERRMLESQISMANRQAQLALPALPTFPVVVDGLANPVPRPAVPAVERVYDPAPDVRMLHLGDTIRYIRGCAPRTRLDTTVFVFLARTP